MSKNSSYEYVLIEDIPDFKSIKIKEVKSFAKMIQELQVKFVFILETPALEDKVLQNFMFIHNGLIYKMDGKGYKAIEDYEDAVKAGFPDADTFYEARKGGIVNYKDYQDCKSTGTVDKILFAKAQKLGFINNFEKFKEGCEKRKGLIPKEFTIEQYNSPVQLCEVATSNGFKDFGDFEKAFFLGFWDRLAYDDSKVKGFTFAEDYFAAVKMGFDDVKEYQEAKRMKIINKFEFNKYNAIKKLNKGIYSFDEVLLMNAIGILENDKKLPLSKMNTLIAEPEVEIKTFAKEDDTDGYPFWYSRKLNTTEDYKNFFIRNKDEMKKYGFFDIEGEFFQIWKLQGKKVYLDGSNVAFGSKPGRSNETPRLYHIKLMVQELNKLGISDISVIADSSLKNRVKDNNILFELEKMTNYLESPSKTQADEFLIQRAKIDKCCIISNDQFNDWKGADTWIAQHIDDMRISFMFDGDTVTFSGIEKILNSPSVEAK